MKSLLRALAAVIAVWLGYKILTAFGFFIALILSIIVAVAVLRFSVMNENNGDQP